ncbi:hypothetical protein U1Q18_041559 [Sarracenia purpurea var. burkii]
MVTSTWYQEYWEDTGTSKPTTTRMISRKCKFAPCAWKTLWGSDELWSCHVLTSTTLNAFSRGSPPIPIVPAAELLLFAPSPSIAVTLYTTNFFNHSNIIFEIEDGATGVFVSDLNLKSPTKEIAVDYDLVIAMVVLLVSFVLPSFVNAHSGLP